MLKSELRGNALWLTLDRPEAFNALSEELVSALQAALDALPPSARAVVIQGAGKVFCAGHDLKQMRAHPSEAYYAALFKQCSRLMMSVQRLRVPVIARVHGIATAAGCQLVAMCDLAVAASDARFATSGINYGLFCATPAVPLSRNMPQKHALEMLLTGGFISAQEAAQRGLINHAVEADALDATVQTLVDSICEKPAEVVALGKQLFYQQQGMGVEAAYQLAAQTMAHNMIDAVALEGVSAFIEKRQPSWR
jgi:enoyl-CoA hydratase/carnithine racemase